MLLPSKHLTAERSIVAVASRVLSCLNTSATVSELWKRFLALQRDQQRTPVGFDWFELALCALFALGQISYDGAVIQRNKPR